MFYKDIEDIDTYTGEKNKPRSIVDRTAGVVLTHEPSTNAAKGTAKKNEALEIHVHTPSHLYCPAYPHHYIQELCAAITAMDMEKASPYLQFGIDPIMHVDENTIKNIMIDNVGFAKSLFTQVHTAYLKSKRDMCALWPYLEYAAVCGSYEFLGFARLLYCVERVMKTFPEILYASIRTNPLPTFQFYARHELFPETGSSVYNMILTRLISFDRLESFKLFVQKTFPHSEPNIHATYVVHALKKQSFKIAMYLIDICAQRLPTHDIYDNSVLHAVVASGNVCVAEKYGCYNNLDVLDAENNTLLHIAAACSNAMMCRYLVGIGCPIDALNNEELTPQQLAHERLIRCLGMHKRESAEVVSAKNVCLFFSEPTISCDQPG